MKSRILKLCIGVFAGVVLIGGATTASAAMLSSGQIQAILGLLQSFNANPATINAVAASLYGTGQVGYPAPTCVVLSANLVLGSSDAMVGGQVSQLQRFLSSRYGVNITSGYFDAQTQRYVAQFQREQNVYPVTGGVGPLTRAAIARVCNGQIYPPPYQNGQLSITNVSGPNSLAVGQQGTWSITTNAPANSYLSTSVRWGDENQYGIYSAGAAYPQVAQQNTFTHSYQNAGTYTITFTVSDNAGHTTPATATVTVGGSSGCGYYGCPYTTPTIDYISPTSGDVGTRITIYGSGFTDNNTIHFGSGGAVHVISSNNGTELRFTVPSYVGPCSFVGDTSPIRCFAADQQVRPGNYDISVSNSNGQSGSVTFRVMSGATTDGTISLTSPHGGDVYYRGDTLPIRWSTRSLPSNAASVVLDLYESGGSKVGTIAVVNVSQNSSDWRIPPFPNTYLCTMQYPNGLCGVNVLGSYYIKATLTANGFDQSATVYDSDTSGTFTVR